MIQQPTDAVYTLACATMHGASRAAEFFVDNKLQLVCLRVKMVGTASDNLSQLESQLDVVRDWTALTSTQSAYMKLQANQSASTIRQWADLLNKAQRSYLRQATGWNDRFQHRPGTATSPAQLLIASLDFQQTLVSTFNAIAASATQAQSSSQPQAKSRNAPDA